MFSAGIERAIVVTLAAHAGQLRRGSPVPYAVHPLHAAFMLARLGLSETAIQAALLHDVVEDCPSWTLARLESEFGAAVASIVEQLTEDKSRTWEQRKRAGIERVASMTPDALAVKAADKLHNLASLARELQHTQDVDEFWGRYRGGRERTLAIAGELSSLLAPLVPAALGEALLASYRELERLANDRADGG